MINQVHFEGYLTRAWEYREQCTMRLANHRTLRRLVPRGCFAMAPKQPSPATYVAGTADGGMTPPRLVAACRRLG